MNATRERLIKCFTAVFPKLSADEAPSATIDSTEGWDSMQHFMLIFAVQEEFGIEIPEEVFAEIVSFSGFEDYLAGRDAVA